MLVDEKAGDKRKIQLTGRIDPIRPALALFLKEQGSMNLSQSSSKTTLGRDPFPPPVNDLKG